MIFLNQVVIIGLLGALLPLVVGIEHLCKILSNSLFFHFDAYAMVSECKRAWPPPLTISMILLLLRYQAVWRG